MSVAVRRPVVAVARVVGTRSPVAVCPLRPKPCPKDQARMHGAIGGRARDRPERCARGGDSGANRQRPTPRVEGLWQNWMKRGGAPPSGRDMGTGSEQAIFPFTAGTLSRGMRTPSGRASTANTGSGTVEIPGAISYRSWVRGQESVYT